MTKKAKQVFSEWRARVIRAEEKIEHLNETLSIISQERDVALEEVRRLREEKKNSEEVGKIIGKHLETHSK